MCVCLCVCECECVCESVCVCVCVEDSMELSDGESVSISDMIDDVVGRKVCVCVYVYVYVCVCVGWVSE